jgi:hypothetical protein
MRNKNSEAKGNKQCMESSQEARQNDDKSRDMKQEMNLTAKLIKMYDCISFNLP